MYHTISEKASKVIANFLGFKSFVTKGAKSADGYGVHRISYTDNILYSYHTPIALQISKSNLSDKLLNYLENNVGNIDYIYLVDTHVHSQTTNKHIDYILTCIPELYKENPAGRLVIQIPFNHIFSAAISEYIISNFKIYDIDKTIIKHHSNSSSTYIKGNILYKHSGIKYLYISSDSFDLNINLKYNKSSCMSNYVTTRISNSINTIDNAYNSIKHKETIKAEKKNIKTYTLGYLDFIDTGSTKIEGLNINNIRHTMYTLPITKHPVNNRVIFIATRGIKYKGSIYVKGVIRGKSIPNMYELLDGFEEYQDIIDYSPTFYSSDMFSNLKLYDESKSLPHHNVFKVRINNLKLSELGETGRFCIPGKMVDLP